MEHVYVFRHKYYFKDEEGTLNLQIASAIFKSEKGVNDFAIDTCMRLLNISEKEPSLDELKIATYIKRMILGKPLLAYKRIDVPCNFDEQGIQLEDDIVEIEKMELRD